MKERRTEMRERRRNFAVGLTTLTGLVGVVVLLTAFGYVPTVVSKGYEVTVYMPNIAGVNVDSRVTLWGRDVGKVTAVGFTDPGSPGRAYVKLKIDEGIALPADIEVRIETPLLGGGPVVAMVGSEPGAAVLATDGSAQITTTRVVDPLMQLEVVSDDIAELKKTWVDVGENINTLFGGAGEAQPSLPRVVMGIEGRIKELQRVLAGAEGWFNDDQLREDVLKTAANAREISETVGEAVTSLEKRYLALADAAEARLVNAEASVGEIEKRYIALADDASKVITVIDKLVAQAESKDGTIGLLLRDPQLYHNLSDTSERLKLMVDEARLLIEKWKAEGVPLRLFD